MKTSRRNVIFAGAFVGSGLAGCQSFIGRDSSLVSLEIVNYTSSTQPIQLSLIRSGTHEFSEARLFSKEVEVPGHDPGEESNQLQVKNVAERRRYLVRVVPKYGARHLYHYHYFPGEATTNPRDPHIIIRIYEARDEGEVYVKFM